ncbi:hypothetical protein ABIE19_000559 [Brevundimonas faecalis]|uniref:Uncharacterized protein n=1 Tax=Brevundimonas faecalis TaxID=947378 RepID=A0ABV2R9J6_9CAUL
MSASEQETGRAESDAEAAAQAAQDLGETQG